MTPEEYIKSLIKKQYSIVHRIISHTTGMASRQSNIGDTIGVKNSGTNSKKITTKRKKRRKKENPYKP